MAIKFVKVKRRNLVYYSLPEEKSYNMKSKENLVQNQTIVNREAETALQVLKKETAVSCINQYSKEYLKTYHQAKGKEFKYSFSSTQAKKIQDSTNTFIDTISAAYRKAKGLRQRMVTFVTLTIPGQQMHTDKVLVRALVDFIDHLKKVKNTEIKDKQDTGRELLTLKNYVWRAETTEAGNIHFHLLFDTYVNHITLKRVWANYLTKLGYENANKAANIHNLENIKDVGSYVTKYLTKPPLNNEFEKLLKAGTVRRDELKNYAPELVYRRPVLYTSWGCSRDLKQLKAPTFSGEDVPQFDEIKNECKAVELPEEIKDFVKVYSGKVYDLIKAKGGAARATLRNKLNYLFDYLYNKTDEYKKHLAETMYINSRRFREALPEFVKTEIAPTFTILDLFPRS